MINLFSLKLKYKLFFNQCFVIILRYLKKLLSLKLLKNISNFKSIKELIFY